MQQAVFLKTRVFEQLEHETKINTSIKMKTKKNHNKGKKYIWFENW